MWLTRPFFIHRLVACDVTATNQTLVGVEKHTNSLPQAMPNDLVHRLVDHLAGLSAHLMHCRVARSRCLEPGKPPSPARRRSFPVLVRAICLTLSSTHALQPYRAYKLTVPSSYGFFKLGMLQHDHEHVPYFPTKSCSRSSSGWYGSQFLNCTYCVVPRRNWTKFRRLDLPLSDFLLVLCRRILPDCFWATGTLENHSRPWESNRNDVLVVFF